MEPRDDDIEFSFFEDEPATTEAASTRARLPRRGGHGTRPPRRSAGPTHGLTPLLRLAGAIVVAIVVLVFFGLLIQSCGSTSKHDAYAHYLDGVATIARSSAADGQQVANALTSPGIKVATLTTKLSGIADQERQNVAAAERLSPPGPVRSENTQLIEALQLRVDGTEGLATTFQATASSKAATDAALLLHQANRLLASDVVYDDLFAGPTTAVMKQAGVVGVRVADSHYVTNQDQLTQNYWKLILDRLRGSTSSGSTGNASGLHGTNIVSTKVLPGGQLLQVSPSTGFTTVSSSPNLAFVVTVHDGGDSQEVRIPVTLTIERPQQKAIVKNQTITVIDPGKDTTVTFPVTEAVPFGSQTKVKVDVSAVPHEHDVTNNTATYPVLFSLGG